MIFPTLSMTTLLGFATVTIAAPHLHSRFERSLAVRESDAIAQGIHWSAKRDNRDNNRDNRDNRDNRRNGADVIQDITITQFSNTVVQDSQRGSDLQLVQLIQERIIVVDNSRQLRDNVRRNTFRNRRNNKNDNVNVVVVVVQEVVDQREDGKNNRRYLARKMQSNRNAQEQVLIVISEANQYTISKEDRATRVQELRAESTGNAQKYASYDPNADLGRVESNSNDFIEELLLPAGAPAPKWKNAEESSDPAVILDLDSNSEAFVVFGNEQDSRNNKNGDDKKDRKNNNNNDNNAIIIAINT